MTNSGEIITKEPYFGFYDGPVIIRLTYHLFQCNSMEPELPRKDF